MRLMLSALLLSAAGADAAGPLSKFDGKKPVADYHSSHTLEVIERCLSDMDGQPMPIAHRQPDRPDEVKLLWIGSSSVDERIDLRREGSGTHVRSWMTAKQAKACAPG